MIINMRLFASFAENNADFFKKRLIIISFVTDYMTIYHLE